MTDTKMLIMSNNKKFEDLNQDFLSFSAQIRSELMNFPKNQGNNGKENDVNPKWAEKILKLEADVESLIKKNQSTEKKFDDFLLFKHSKEISEINEKIEEIKTRVSDNNFKIDSSPQKSGSGIFSPQREGTNMIDDERFNSIIEKTKKNIELALSK